MSGVKHSAAPDCRKWPRLRRSRFRQSGAALGGSQSHINRQSEYDLEGRQRIAQVRHRFVETDHVARVVGRSLASADELAAMQDAWQVWTELPNGFCAVLHGEAVGWKK